MFRHAAFVLHSEALRFKRERLCQQSSLAMHSTRQNKRVLSEVFAIVIKKLDLTEDFKVKVSMEFMDNRSL